MQTFRAFVAAQPNDVPFVFAYKGKYIVQVEKSTVGSAHVNAYYYVDNSQNLVDHDFEAGVPAAGQLTIEKTSHITPGSTAAFATELRAFLESVGLASINLQGGRAFNWYDATAAYLEPPVVSIQPVLNEDDERVLGLKIGDDIVVPAFDMGGEEAYMTYNNGRIQLNNVTHACPLDLSKFNAYLSDSPLVDDVTTSPYTIVADSCSTDGTVDCSLVPVDASLPVVKIKLFWEELNSEWILKGLFYFNELKEITELGLDNIELGSSGYVIANDVMTQITFVDGNNATLKVDNVGAPDNCAYHNYVQIDGVNYYTDAYTVEGSSAFGQQDIIDSIKDVFGVTNVTVSREALNLEDMQYGFEV